MLRSLVGSEMCIRDRVSTQSTGIVESGMLTKALVLVSCLAVNAAQQNLEMDSVQPLVLAQGDFGLEPPGKCATAELAASSWASCADGSHESGEVTASESGILDLDGCKAAVMVLCYPRRGLYASFNRPEDKCGWYTECDMTSLKNTDSGWRTRQAVMGADQMAMVTNAATTGQTPEQTRGKPLELMICGTSCVCSGLDACIGECNYECSSHEAITPVYTSTGSLAPVAAILNTKGIQNPIKACFSLGYGATGAPWTWQDIQLVKVQNRFKITAAPGHAYLSSSTSTSCRTLSEPCFTNTGPCPSPAVPPGWDHGIQARYWQVSQLGCSVPSQAWLGGTTPDMSQIEHVPTPISELPFVSLAQAASTVHFLADWSGGLHVTEGGSYQFFVQATGSVRLWVDGTELISSTGCLVDTEKSGSIDLTAGRLAELILSYSHTGIDGAVELSYQGPDTDNSKLVIPESVLWHRISEAPEMLVVTVVGKGKPPHIKLCGTRRTQTSCEFDASCEESCTESVPVSSWDMNSLTAKTVSIQRGTATDYVGMVTKVCFVYPPGQHSYGDQFDWKSATIQGQKAADGAPFAVRPMAHGELQAWGHVGTGAQRCFSGAEGDTARLPYDVADNHQPDETDYLHLST
eukprot:TRINITY_DN7704_c0_g1_i4.p1 TRINITY_DN7704_c0_g1~~TRINITY_DN7704_c0_g1_i4.p1  ORF type:complete len:671 (-),score=94.62 TRINITY_DN7704_c0_g1_i4:535-2436(-)